MSIGNNKLPYPAACGGDGCYTGAIFNHKSKNDTVAVMQNSTTYTIDGTPNTPAEPLNNITDECGNAQGAPYATQLPSIIDTFVLAHTPWPYNTFVGTGTTVDLGACRLEGFKNLQTYAVWHGDFGFTYLDTGYKCSDSSKATRRFRTLKTELSAAHSISFTEHVTNSGILVYDRLYQFGGTWADTVTCTVGQHDGKRTVTQTLASRDPASYPITITDQYTPGSTSTTLSADFLAYNGSTIGSLGSAYKTWGKGCYSSAPGFTFPAFSDGAGGHLVGVPADITAQITSYYSSFPQLSVTVNICSISETVIELKFTVVPASYSQTIGTIKTDYGGSGSAVFHLTCTLSDELTLSTVRADAESLAARWMLKSQTLYPFRTDSNGFVAPFINYKGAQLPVSPRIFPAETVDDYSRPEISPGVWNQIPWFDTDAYHWQNGAGVYPNNLILDYTGEVLGEPLAAGYGQGTPRGVFNLQAKAYWRTVCSGHVTPSVGDRWVGQFTPGYLPANCAQWTDEARLKEDSNLMWPCPFVLVTADGVYLQKWAETIVPAPYGSYNFARPYGDDRFAYDETKVYCTDGTHIYAGTTPVPDGALAGYWGGVTAGGVYSGCTVSGGDGTLTLGTKICDLPTGWSDRNAGDEDMTFGKFPWFDISPGFGGRLGVTASYDPGANETTFTYANSPNILNGDKISVIGFGNVTLGTNLTLTRLSDTSGKVTGNFTGAAFITPYKLFDNTTDGLKWWFANDTRKGTFVARTWLVDIVGGSTLSHTETESCLPYTQNCAPVLVASPQAESFANAFTMTWPGAVDMDNVWIGQFEQWMVDPFWQPLHTLCNGDPQPDEYCLTPYIEARLTVRTDFGFARNETAPTPPSPINLNPTVNPPQNARPGLGRVPDSLGAVTPDPPWHIRSICGYT